VGAKATESELERKFVRFLRKHGFAMPERQYWIREGEFEARVDFAFVDLRIAIELQSFQHHGGRAPFDRDLERSNQLVALGWLPLHITDAHLNADFALAAKLDALSVPRQRRLDEA
jgi:very-short-patch-repair endonuclease